MQILMAGEPGSEGKPRFGELGLGKTVSSDRAEGISSELIVREDFPGQKAGKQLLP